MFFQPDLPPQRIHGIWFYFRAKEVKIVCCNASWHTCASTGLFWGNFLLFFSTSHVRMGEVDHKEGWALKNWCFWTAGLEKTLESPLDSKRSNQSILKEINIEYSLEGLMLKEKLQILWPPDCEEHQQSFWCWERLKAGEAGDRGQDGWMASPTQWTRIWANSRR